MTLIDQKLGVLWDFDGTILDTKHCHFSSWQYALKSHGYTLNQNLFDANFGRNNRSILPIFLGFEPDRGLAAKIIREKEARFRVVAEVEAQLVPGVENWLADIKTAGIPQVVASSAPIDNITILLSRFELTEYFTSLISGADLPAKPEPDVFLKAASIINLDPSCCLVIEDTLSGVRAAKNAGMKCVAVATTHFKRELAEADVVIKTFHHSLSSALRVCGFEQAAGLFD